MLDEKLFEKLKKEYESYDIGRRIIIKHSNEILKFSKQIIFSLHREKVKEADIAIKEAEKLLKYLHEKIDEEQGLKYEGAYLAGIEEYVEAMLFYNFIKTGKIAEIKKFKFAPNTYLGGLSDFTGELVRRAVFLATNRRYDEVAICQQAIETVLGEMIQLNMMGRLRQKFDQTKHNLRKIEEIMYDLEIKRRK